MPQFGTLYGLIYFRSVPKKILVITPRFPLPDAGACEKDRLEGIKQLKRLGFEVAALAKVFSFQAKDEIKKFASDFDLPVKLLPYENKLSIKKLLNPFYWDGAAYEYSLPAVKKALVETLEDFKPDLAWVDYTYLWPLYSILRKFKVPIITRSINFEPRHFLQEEGHSPLNLLKFLSKLAGEVITILESSFLFAITPEEEKIYRRFGAKNIAVLPLRGLPLCFKNEHKIENKEILNVFFAGSTYSVPHNRKALELIVRKIAPAIEQKMPGRFIFHITGRKFPANLKLFLNEGVVYHGTINHWEEFLKDMDIAIVPSLFGAGMQQKIFEPLCRGIPAIASSRGLAGYQFKNEEHLLVAETAEDFIKCIFRLEEAALRQRLAENARKLALQIFSQSALDQIIVNTIHLSR